MFVRVSLAIAILALVAGCAGGSGSPTPGATVPASPAGSASTRIEVTLTDALRIEPADMSVPAGVPVTFVVTNSGSTDHEFYLGDEAAQAEHEQEMQAGGMMHDEPDGVMVSPGETAELTHTFEAGPTLAGCHVAGHYAGGMKATITAS